MAKLLDQDKDDIFADIMRKWSLVNLETPITKVQGRALIDIMDDGMETAETTIISNIPAGVAKTWLLANTPIARKIIELVANKRQETL